MFDLEKSFGYDSTLASEGAIRKLGTDPEDYIKLRRIPNPDYKAMLSKEYRAISETLDMLSDEAKSEMSERILDRVVATTVVSGWGKGVMVGGKHVPYTVENCMELFKKYPEFRSGCVSWAENNANFQTSKEVSVEQVKKR